MTTETQHIDSLKKTQMSNIQDEVGTLGRLYTTLKTRLEGFEQGTIPPDMVSDVIGEIVLHSTCMQLYAKALNCCIDETIRQDYSTFTREAIRAKEKYIEAITTSK